MRLEHIEIKEGVVIVNVDLRKENRYTYFFKDLQDIRDYSLTQCSLVKKSGSSYPPIGQLIRSNVYETKELKKAFKAFRKS